jgi:hypothetical protein
MKTLKVLVFCLFHFAFLNAQQLEVINSGGGYLENGEGSITFSIGEVVIETIAHGELCFTQGFCQANVTVTAIGEIPSLDYELLAYPNPTKNFVILKTNKDNLTHLKYLLYDFNGRLLTQKDIVSNETKIPFQFLIPSTYLLKIIDKEVEVKTFKIIKSN